jgi:hypothetical protein
LQRPQNSKWHSDEMNAERWRSHSLYRLFYKLTS